MHVGGAEAAPSGEAETVAAPKTKSDDEWGKFYSMPPKWTKDERQSNSANKAEKSESGMSDENIGHKLASLLRYHLDGTSGISTDEEGWVVVEQIVENAEDIGLAGVSAEDLVRVAENNEHSTRGKRFESDGAGRIKATYRHPPKDRRGFGDRDRDSWRGRGRDRPRGDNGWSSNGGWENYSKWKEGDGWQGGDKQGDDSWWEWKKPGFSPSPDDAIVKESTWAGSAEKVESAVKPSPQEAASSEKKACDWEQWFTPDSLEMYFYNTQTEEVFFPGDAGETEEKGWFRYVDTEGEKQDKIYWWHEATERSFYEEDAIGDETEA